MSERPWGEAHSPGSTWIRGFNGIRGLAAIMVVFTHVGSNYWLRDAGVPELNRLLHGGVGVSWFYALSGFLITLLLLREHEATGTVRIRAFLIRRGLRLYPLYYFVVLLVGLSTLLSPSLGTRAVDGESFLFAVLYAYNLIPREHYDTWFGSFHTLATEEQFYLVFPLVFFALRRSPAALAVALSVAIVLTPWVYSILDSYSLGALFFIERWLPIVGDVLAMGCLAGVAFHCCRDQLRPYTSLFGLLGLALHLFPLLWEGETATEVGITLLVLYVALAQESRPVRLLEWAPLDYLGKISYGIYVWQSFFLTTDPRPRSGWPLPAPIALTLVFVVAPLSYRYLERPFLDLKKRFSAPRAS